MRKTYFLLLLWACPMAAAAGPDGRADTLAYQLDGVVVTANKWRQPKYTLTRRVLTLDPRQVLLENPQTTADLLGATGEVFIQKSQLGGGSPMIRGFATNRLLYTVDGIRMNTAIFRAGNLQNVISIDPFALQRTEVMMGPGSVIYGSDAIGGVIGLYTKSPLFSGRKPLSVSGNASLRCSSANNERTGHFDVNVGGRNWAALTSVSHFRFDDLRQGTHGPDSYLRTFYVQRQDGKDIKIDNPKPLSQTPSGYTQTNIMQKLRFSPAVRWDLTYAFHYSETSDYARYDRLTRMKKDNPQFAEWNYGPQKWMLNQLTLTHRQAGILYDEMTVRLGIQRFEESRISRKWNKTERTTNTETVDACSVNADFAKNLLPAVSLYYGLEYVNDRVRSEGVTLDITDRKTSVAPARYPQSRWETAAGYAQASCRLLPALNLEAGVRYTGYRLRADFSQAGMELPFAPRQTIRRSNLTGSVGVNWRPGGSWVLRGSVSRGFRCPNVDDMGKLYESVAGAVVVPNTGLRPEYATNYELGVSGQAARWLSVDVSAYYTDLDQALVRRGFRWNGQDSIVFGGEKLRVLAIQNAAAARVYGAQAYVRIQPCRFVVLDTHLNWQHGREELDDGSHSTLRHTVPFFGRASLTFQWTLLQLQAYTVWQAGRKAEDMPEEERDKTEIYPVNADGSVYSPGWYTINLKVLYRIGKRTSLTCGLENITDRRYRTYSSGISAPGRNFICAVNYSF